MYVDGFVVPVPTRNLAVYEKMARQMGRIFREHGAIEFRECVGDDMETHCGLPFPRGIATKRGETVMFSWIAFRSKADRKRVNAAVMKDPRVEKMMAKTKMPFDPERMLYGGFKTIVDV